MDTRRLRGIGSIGAVVTTALALATLASMLSLWQVNQRNARLEAELKKLSVASEMLKSAQLKPQFAASYLFLRGSIYDSALSRTRFGQDPDFPTKFAAEAYERLWAFPLLDQALADSLHPERIHSFLRATEGPQVGLGDYEIVSPDHLVLVLSAFGGTMARDVELIYDRKEVAAPYVYDPRYTVENLLVAETEEVVTRKAGQIARRRAILRLGDIAPGDGRLIEVQASLRVNFYDSTVQFPGIGAGHVLAREYLLPLAVRYKTISGETLVTPIRRPLGIPIPVAAGVEGLG